MILPFPEDLKDLRKYPLTVTLVILNIFIFVLIFSGVSASKLSSNAILDSEGLRLTGRLYFQYLQKIPAQELYTKPKWSHQLHSTNEEQMEILGSYALRDSQFLAQAETYKYFGDEVRIANWKNDFAQFRKKYQEQHLYLFGLSSAKKNPLSWITYQFSHSSWIHLISNLLFLVLIGAAVEGLVGSGALLFVYLVGGIAGGISFITWDMNGAVPMVGASASISALLLFYSVAETKRRIRYLYVVSPLPGQYGSIYLPTLLIVPLYILADLSSLWSTPEGLGGGVAYAAHLGGAAVGAVIALFYRWKNIPVLTQS